MFLELNVIMHLVDAPHVINIQTFFDGKWVQDLAENSKVLKLGKKSSNVWYLHKSDSSTF